MLMEEHLQKLLERLYESGVSEEDLQSLIALRAQTTQALENAHFDQDDQLDSDDLLILVDAVTSLSNLADAKKLALLVAGYAAYFLGADDYSYWEWQPVAREFVPLNPSGIFGGESEPKDGDHAKSMSVQPFLEAAFHNLQVGHILSGDPDLSPREQAALKTVGVSAILSLPMAVDAEPAGVILICDLQKAYGFQEYQLFMAQLLVNHAGVVLSRAQMCEAAERRAAELESLRQASLILTASLDLQKVLDTILEHTLGLIQRAQDVHIFLYDNGVLTFKSVLWADGRKGQAWANPREDGLTYTVARKGELIRVADTHKHPLYENTIKEWSGSIIGLPLKIRDRVVGVMTASHPDINAFSEDEIRILRLLGDQASVAIENARLHDAVNQQAHTDALTGLPNRRALNERMESELRRSIRYQRCFSMVMLDLDGFKTINDKYGHPQGDEVLRDISRHMLDTIRDTDYLARYGGDEFALLLPETDADTARQMAVRLQKEVASYRVDFEQQSGARMGISFGCATYPDHGDQVEKLMSIADENLYRLKDEHTNGKNNE